ncbi:MAG: HAD-IA family hydrolase [Gemmatimonadetes bacterium]|nr:HAD-IA family hydrolase [Gemmatimonadota bacterium]NIO31294.1 HAD-IA family hydrolase [Gemmatimonadota bacterium]
MMAPTAIPVADGVRGLIFDCDGTLADTMPYHQEGWRQAFGAAGVSVPDAWLDSLRGTPEKRVVALANERFGFSLDPAATVAAKHRVYRRLLEGVRPIEPVVAVVRAHQGRLPMAIASGGTREDVHTILERLGLAEAFAVVLTADDEIEHKPSPQIFLEAARRLGVEPAACQVFEDGDIGLEAARRAGMTATDVRPYI